MMCVFTGVLFLAEIIVGYLVSSLALVADAFHMLSDLLAIIIALAAIRVREIAFVSKVSSKMGKRSRSESMTYGWVRAEILGGLFNGILLLSLCFNIFVEAIQRFFDPPGIHTHSIISFLQKKKKQPS